MRANCIISDLKNMHVTAHGHFRTRNAGARQISDLSLTQVSRNSQIASTGVTNQAVISVFRSSGFSVEELNPHSTVDVIRVSNQTGEAICRSGTSCW